MAESVDSIVDSTMKTVNFANAKNVGELPAWCAGVAMSDTIDHRRRTQVIGEQLLAAWGKALIETDPIQAQSVWQMQTGHQFGQHLAGIAGALTSVLESIRAVRPAPAA